MLSKSRLALITTVMATAIASPALAQSNSTIGGVSPPKTHVLQGKARFNVYDYFDTTAAQNGQINLPQSSRIPGGPGSSGWVGTNSTAR